MTFFDHQDLAKPNLFDENFKVPAAQMIIIQWGSIGDLGVGEMQRVGNS